MQQHHLPKDTAKTKTKKKEWKKTTEIRIINLLQLYEGRRQREENTISHLSMPMSCFSRYSMKKGCLFICSLPVCRSDRTNGWKLMECESHPKRMVNVSVSTAFRRSPTDVRRTDSSLFLSLSRLLRTRHSGFHFSSSSSNWYCHTPYRILLSVNLVGLSCFFGRSSTNDLFISPYTRADQEKQHWQIEYTHTDSIESEHLHSAKSEFFST